MKRAAVQVRRDRTVKRFYDPADAAREAGFYRRFPWACPRLLDVDDCMLVVETLPVAYRIPAWRPASALRELLEALHEAGVHHRDVHVRNIVKGETGPLLIDWETAIDRPSVLSYDLAGPASGIPIPDIHHGLTPQWWGSQQAMSIRNRWERNGVSTTLDQRP